MKSSVTSKTAHLYKLHYSKWILGVEIGLHLFIMIAITQLIEDNWVYLFITLYVLIIIRFFSKDSTIRKYNAHSGLQIEHQAMQLICYGYNHENRYLLHECKIFFSRWFILLQLGKGRNRIIHLLLADSFSEVSDYVSFRRELIEITNAS